MNYKEAEKLAQRLSLDNPGECFYVNLLDNSMEYCVDNEPEIDDQPFYRDGEVYYNEADYEHDVLGYHREDEE